MMRVRPLPAASQQGFSLVELLVVMAIFGAIGAIVTPAIISAFTSSSASAARLEATNELRVAMQRMTRDFRTAEEVRLYDDRVLAEDISVDIDTDPNSLLEVRYRVVTNDDGTFLERADTSQTLVTALGNEADDPVFTYLNSRGEVIDCETQGNAACVRARQIRIRLVRDVPNDRRPIELESLVAIRNVRYQQ
jgi:prepilin-type N-terminal cleavage/methylation domain-containing protein